ncbi:riboflavin synthase domain-like protein [Poronia punctata]|nr:riboflavin synthase domain-like protein [Poronia punctata]
MMAAGQNPAQDGNSETAGHRNMLILYGSETGNSEDAAGEIERMAMRLHFQTSLEEMNDVQLSDLLRYSLVVFVISTTGQGDLPRNARQFWKSLLRKRLPPDCLRRVRFTTFGLGDSSYFQYNWAARKLHKRLEQLGAVEFLPRGEADERHEEGIDGTLLSWCLTLKTYLEKEYPVPSGLSPIPSEVLLPPKFTLELAGMDVNMDSTEEARLDGASIVPTSTLQSYGDRVSTSLLEGADTHKPSTMSPQKNDVDSHGRELDFEPAQYSHQDLTSGQVAAMKAESPLDKPDENLLHDAPFKYSLEDSAKRTEEAPPVGLLPVPNAVHGLVAENRRITPSSHWQDVRHLRIIVPSKEYGEDCGPKPCDVAVIYPKNFSHDVQTLIDLMGWHDVANQRVRHVSHGLAGIRGKQMLKDCYPLEQSTLRQLLIHNYDITSIPKRSFFSQIAFYTEDDTHKERLMEFGNPLYSDEFYDYTSRPRRSILEVLQDFPTVRIPYQAIPSVFPVIRGREYSIAAPDNHHREGGSEGDTTIELLVALVKYKTVLRKTRHGLCSRYISSLPAGTPISLSIRPNPNPAAKMVEKPLIAIAAGTGIAPVRSILLYRESLWRSMSGTGIPKAETLLFYGGRNRAADFYFENEWPGIVSEVITAFSRDQPAKIYVQDRLLEHSEQICDLLRKDAVICLCGSSGKMPAAVRQALYTCMVKGGLAKDDGEAKEMLHKKHLFWEEVW